MVGHNKRNEHPKGYHQRQYTRNVHRQHPLSWTRPKKVNGAPPLMRS